MENCNIYPSLQPIRAAANQSRKIRLLVTTISGFGILLFSGLPAAYADYPIAQFLLLNPSIRSVGMGNAYTALAEDSGGMTINPTAGVMVKNSEIYFSNASWAALEMNMVNYLGFISQSKSGNFAFGMYLQGFNSGEIGSYDSNGVQTGNVEENNTAVGFNLSFKVANMVAFGMTGKVVSFLMSTTDSDIKIQGNAFATDIGMNLISPNERFLMGFSFNNLGGKMVKSVVFKNFSYDGTKEPLPTNMKMGMAFKLLRNRNWILSMDYDTGMIALKKLSGEMKIGTEVSPFRWLALRFGISGLGNYLASSSFGLGLKLKRLEIDFANTGRGNLGNTSNVSFKYAFARKERTSPEPEIKPVPEEAREELKPIEEEIKIEQKKIVEEQKMKPEIKKQPEEIPAPPPAKKPEERMNIAVAEFSGRNVSSMEAAIISDFLRAELVNTEQFTVLDRQNMETVLSEHKFQLTGCTTEECAVQMGKLLGVKKMVTGNLAKLLDKFYVVINILDVETGKIEYADKDSATNADELSTACSRIASHIVRKYR